MRRTLREVSADFLMQEERAAARERARDALREAAETLRGMEASRPA